MGFDVVTGRLKIVKEVLNKICNYLYVQVFGKQARIERFRRSVWDLDYNAQVKNTLLRLEPPTRVTLNVSKDEVLVFDFETHKEQGNGGVKFMASAIKAGAGIPRAFYGSR